MFAPRLEYLAEGRNRSGWKVLIITSFSNGGVYEAMPHAKLLSSRSVGIGTHKGKLNKSVYII